MGWIGFLFKVKDDTQKILSVCWFCNLCTKPWHPLFDASVEGLKILLISIKISNLPLDYWSDEGLKGIGDVLGTFIVFDASFKFSSNRSMV